MSRKRVLLVGVSSGMGLMAAKQLLTEHDCEVYAAAPDLPPMAELESLGAKLIRMDVASSASVKQAVEETIENLGGLDVVYFNAGLNFSGAIEALSEEMVEQLYQVNVFGLARVLRAVSPQLRKQRAGRIVVTGSVVSHVTVRMMGWYSSSKHALYSMMTAYRQEVADFGIDVVIIEPGQINTGFDQAAMARMEKMGHPEDYQQDVRSYLRMNTENLKKAPDATGTAQAMVKAIVSDRSKLVVRTTPDAVFLPLISRLLGPRRFDRFVARLFNKFR